MTAYEIIDLENSVAVGILQYFEKENSWIIELKDDLDEWSAPLLFAGLVKKGIYSMPRSLSHDWVRSRVIPSERQNIEDILNHHRLKAYDEMMLLELSEGKCSQDSLMIRKTDRLPDYVMERTQKNLVDCILTGNNSMLLFFRNEEVRKVCLERMTDIEGVDKIIASESLYRTGKVGTGGYSAVFNDSIEIPSAELYERSTSTPLKISDFKAFVQENVIDTTQTCNILECSRQNVAYMVKQGQLAQVKGPVNGSLYFKGDVLANKW